MRKIFCPLHLCNVFFLLSTFKINLFDMDYGSALSLKCGQGKSQTTSTMVSGTLHRKSTYIRLCIEDIHMYHQKDPYQTKVIKRANKRHTIRIFWWTSENVCMSLLRLIKMKHLLLPSNDLHKQWPNLQNISEQY